MSEWREDPEAVARVRSRLMAKGQNVASRLAEVLAGKDINLSALGDNNVKRLRPEERLRAFLDLINRKRQTLDNSPNDFGRCEACNADLGLVALQEMPWAERCRECV